MFTITGDPPLVGVPIHIDITFQDLSNAYKDPANITFKYVPAGGVRTTIVAPDSRIVKDAVGQYHIDLSTVGMAAGRLQMRLEATGGFEGAEDGEIVIRSSPLVP